MTQRVAASVKFRTQCHDPVVTPVTILPQGGSTVGAVRITAGGTGYSGTPTVAFTGGGATTQATGNVVAVAGVVVAVNILTPGVGYTSAPTVTISGAGTGATAVAVLAPTLGEGDQASSYFTPSLLTGYGVVGASITAGGSGYTSVPTVVVTPSNGLGSGAILNVSISAGAITGLSVANPGTGYTAAPTVTVMGGGGTGATVAVVMGGVQATGLILLTTNDPYQALVYADIGPSAGWVSEFGPVALVPSPKFSPVGGSQCFQIPVMNRPDINSVTGTTVTAGGTGYTFPPAVIATGGGGQGASFTATVAAGAVTALTIVNPGLGYTSAPTLTISGGNGTGATATASLTAAAASAAADMPQGTNIKALLWWRDTTVKP